MRRTISTSYSTEKKLLCDAERDLLATVKFLVIIFLSIIIFVVHMRTDS